MYNSRYVNADNITFQNYNPSYPSQKLAIITPGVNAPEMGEKALEVRAKDNLGFWTNTSTHTNPMGHNFSFQLFNPSNVDTLVVLSINVVTETTRVGYIYKTITVKPGLNTFNNKDLFTSEEYSELNAATEFYINNNPTTNHNDPTINPSLWFDNLLWEPPYWEKTSTLLVADESIHLLDVVDALIDEYVIGKADQNDTLQLTGKEQHLDLTTLDAGKINSIEIFDITGTGDNTLKLDLTVLLQHGEKELFIEDGKTQLMVKGNQGDVVQLKDILPDGGDIGEWQHQEGTVTVAGIEYQVYSHDDAELLVQQGVKTELV